MSSINTRSDVDDFLDSWQKRGLLPLDRSVLAAIYHDFCNHALDWLLNQDKPIDLYFIRLIPMPHRLDWKERVLLRIKDYGLAGVILNTEKLATDENFRNLLLSGKLLNVENGVISRCIEVEHKRQWWTLAKKVEQTRRKALGSGGYARSVLDQIRNKFEASANIASRWAKQVAIGLSRAGRVPNGGNYLAGPIRPGLASNAPVDRVIDRLSKFMPEEKSRQPMASGLQVTELQGMRCVQQGAADMRDSGTDGI
jgi:hypothetical protein